MQSMFKKLLHYQRINRQHQTNTENYIETLLIKLNIKYISQKGFINGNFFYLVDFYLPKPYKICIELDGDYHNNTKQIYRDVYKEQYLKSRKFKILRLTNNIANSLSPEDLYNLITIYSRKISSKTII